MRYWYIGSLVNLALIEAFAAVMKSGSTTRAAELLGVSQPAISRSLKRLEDTTRLRLFERNGPRLIPTDEARQLYQEIVDSYVGLDRLKQAVTRIRAVGTGSIRIAASAALGLTFMPRVISRFADGHPGVTVTFEIANSATVRNLVASGAFDIGLCADEIDRTNLHTEPFIATRGICVMLADHPLANATVVRPEDLHEVSFISLAPDDSARKLLDRALVRVAATPHIVVETQFAATVCQLAVHGVGIGLTNSLAYISGGFEAQGLAAVRFEPKIPFRALLVRPPDHARSQIIHDLSAILRTERDLLASICKDRFGSVH